MHCESRTNASPKRMQRYKGVRWKGAAGIDRIDRLDGVRDVPTAPTDGPCGRWVDRLVKRKIINQKPPPPTRSRSSASASSRFAVLHSTLLEPQPWAEKAKQAHSIQSIGCLICFPSFLWLPLFTNISLVFSLPFLSTKSFQKHAAGRNRRGPVQAHTPVTGAVIRSTRL